MAGTGTIGAEIWEQAIDRQDARACCLAPFGRADERGRSGPPAAIERGDNRADIDRDTAQLALTDVVAFFLDHRIEAQPLVRLLGELAALSAGSKPSPMLKAATTRHRSPDPPIIQSVKGRLAAIMEFRQKTGSSRRAAREWVARNIPSKTTRRLGSVTPSAAGNRSPGSHYGHHKTPDHGHHGNGLDEIKCETNARDGICLFEEQVDDALTNPRKEYRDCQSVQDWTGDVGGK